MSAAVSRQVRRAIKRHQRKVMNAENRVADRIEARKAKGLTPLDRKIVREPYPADKYRPFQPSGKDWKATAAEQERAKHSGIVTKAARGVKRAVIATAGAVALAAMGR